MSRRTLLLFLGLILIASTAFRFWFALVYWAGKPLTHDATEYLELADHYNRTGEFAYDDDGEQARPATTQIESYGRAPGYPFWLALLLRVSDRLAWIRFAEVLLSLCQTFLFYLVARRLFDRPGAAVAAAAVASLYLPLLALAPVVLSENLWVTLILVSYYLLLGPPGEKRVLLSTTASFAVLAAATLVRPGTIFLIPFFAWWCVRSQRTPKSATLLAGIIVYLLVLLPWEMELYRQHGRFIFVASEGGVTFWTGTHPQYSGDGDLAVNPPVQKDYRELLRQNSSLTPSQREKIYFQNALQNILLHPWAYVKNECKKLFYWFIPLGRSVTQASLAHRAVSVLFYIPVLVIGLMGFRRSPVDARLFCAGLALSFTVMILLFLPQERFRISTIDPLLLLLSACQMEHWLAAGRRGARSAAV